MAESILVRQVRGLGYRLWHGLLAWPVALALALAALAPTLSAQVQDEPEAQAVRAVVQAQLAAFAAGDAERAFSYASPGIRERFGSADSFMAMVVQSYPMVVRPISVAFLRPRSDRGIVVQPVQLRDGAGRPWIAYYGLSREADGGWRINGCVVSPSLDGPIT